MKQGAKPHYRWIVRCIDWWLQECSSTGHVETTRVPENIIPAVRVHSGHTFKTIFGIFFLDMGISSSWKIPG